jgi:hypothetical protein
MRRFFELFLPRPTPGMLRSGRSYHCRCGRAVFFENSRCAACHAVLGYEPFLSKVFSIEPIPGTKGWRLAEDEPGARAEYRCCANRDTPAACNWLVPDLDKIELTEGLCIACRLNRTIPDLSVPENCVLWGRIEVAKRRLVSLLLALEIPLESKDQDPERGLAFDFLRSPAEGPRVLTGHANGLITLNIEEAQASTRERIRENLNEPYRTVLGHLRHEVGHYYWNRLIADTPWIHEFRRLFGDERADYSAALKRHYAKGAPADWATRFVSSYASSHPWEDWAETWAHVLHMADTLATAMSFGIDPRLLDLEIEPFPREALYQPEEPEAERFLNFFNAWIGLTAVMNEMSKGMGLPDFYPFTVPKPVVARIHFIFVVTRAERDRLQRLETAKHATS